MQYIHPTFHSAWKKWKETPEEKSMEQFMYEEQIAAEQEVAEVIYFLLKHPNISYSQEDFAAPLVSYIQLLPESRKELKRTKWMDFVDCYINLYKASFNV